MNHATPRRFNELSLRVGVIEEIAERVFGGLMVLYYGENRAYHNLLHIDRMLLWLDESGEASDAVELAIWFHDAIYDPQGSQNEAKSAQYFTDHFGSHIDDALGADVERLILATDPTRARSGQGDEDLIIDIDLSILGSSPKDYDIYRLSVRSEYSFVSDTDFSAGRSLILEGFLSQKIYATEFFSPLESKARSNLKRELLILQAAENSSS